MLKTGNFNYPQFSLFPNACSNFARSLFEAAAEGGSRFFALLSMNFLVFPLPAADLGSFYGEGPEKAPSSIEKAPRRPRLI